MSAVEALIQGLLLLFSWPTFGWMAIGILVGIVLGAIPGVGAVIGMAILLPLTIPLDGHDAIIFLICLYLGTQYGGAIAAILINTPGVPAAAASTFEGYPLSKQGKAMDALAISAVSSTFGGLFSVVLLLLISPFLIWVVLIFGPPEYFLMALFGIVLISVVTQGPIVKGIIAGAFGLALTSIGSIPMTTEVRYTFGYLELYDGLDFVIMLIGVFAIPEMIRLSRKRGGITEQGQELQGNLSTGIRAALAEKRTAIKSSLIGMGIGSIPGAGATVSNFISYGEEVRSSGDPDSFGKGRVSGLVASESSNSATVAGSLVPTFSFGIPGSGSTAVLLGGLILHGLNPGPDLFTENLHITYSVFLSLFVGCLIIFVFGLLIVTKASYLTQINTHYVVPVVIVLATLGSLAVRNNWIDPLSIILAGFLSYYMIKHNYSIIAFVLGIVLGGIAEQNLNIALQIGGGSPAIFFTRPLSVLFIVIIVAVVALPFVKQLRNR